VLLPHQQAKVGRGTKDKEHAMSQKIDTSIAVVGIDIGKNSFHVVGLDQRGAIVLRQKWSRGQVEARFANMPPCLIGMEACVGLSRSSLARAGRRNRGSASLPRRYPSRLPARRGRTSAPPDPWSRGLQALRL
jgi:hypothetical protein